MNYDFAEVVIGGMAVFRSDALKSEAVVPMSASNENRFSLAFDNTKGYVLGIAMANPDSITSTFEMTFTDEQGNQLGDTVSLTLPAKGHTAYVLTDVYPQLKDKRGVIDFKVNDGKLSVLGLRFSPNQGPFTSVHTLESWK